MIIKKLRYFKRKILGQFILEDHLKKGLTVGKNFNCGVSTKLDYSHCWHIKIGDDVTFAPDVTVLAHDASTKFYINYSKVKNVEIGDRVFVGARSIILPGVKIGNDVIIGAGSICTKSIPDNSIVVGNPAKIISTTKAYIDSHLEAISVSPLFEQNLPNNGESLSSYKKDLIEKASYDFIYVE